MASVDWSKIKEGGMRHLAVHYQQSLRESVKHHSNQHINQEKTKDNFSLGAKDFYEACDKINARIKEVDEKYPPKRKTKDRVTACSLYIVCPAEISALGEDKTKEFFEKAYKALEDHFGAENVGGGFVHMDEIHTYKDAETKEDRQSLHHMNVFVAAFVDEDINRKPTKKNPKAKEHLIGINGKHFCSRKRMNEVNKIMESVCHEYGHEWHTGKGKNYETVETLKAKSAKAERELEEIQLQEISSKIEEGKNVLEITEFEKKETLEQLRIFIKACQLPKTVEDTIFQVLDTYEKWREMKNQKVKSWTPEKEKNDTVIKEKRKGIDDIDR